MTIFKKNGIEKAIVFGFFKNPHKNTATAKKKEQLWELQTAEILFNEIGGFGSQK